MMTFLDRLRPDLFVSLHQHYNAVDAGVGKTAPWSALLGQALGLRVVTVPCNIGKCTGTMTQWFNHRAAGSAITVELPLSVGSAAAQRYARGILQVGGRLVPAGG